MKNQRWPKEVSAAYFFWPSLVFHTAHTILRHIWRLRRRRLKQRLLIALGGNICPTSTDGPANSTHCQSNHACQENSSHAVNGYATDEYRIGIMEMYMILIRELLRRDTNAINRDQRNDQGSSEGDDRADQSGQ